MSLVLAISFGAFDKFNYVEPSEVLQSYLDTEYDRALGLVKNAHPKEIDFNQLADSPFDVLISEKDKVVFWNNIITSLQNRNISSEEYLILFKDIQNKHNVTIGLDLTDNGKLDELLRSKLNLDFNSKRGENQLVEILDIKKVAYSIKVSRIHKFSWLSQVSFVFYFLFLTSILALLFHLIFIKKRLSPGLGILSGIGLLLFHVFIGNDQYTNTVLASVSNDHCLICTDVQSLLVLLLIAVFSLNILKRSKILSKINAIITDIAATFFITFSFVFLSHLAKEMLYSSSLQSLHSEVLQYSTAGIIYVISFIAMLATIFYGSIILFKYSQSNENQLQKYLGWLAGVIATIPLALFLDIDIPLWTLYTFVISYLLILELYIENEEKNIIYTIWWIIIFSGFLASITFYYRLNSNMEVQADNISSLYSYTEDKDVRMVTSIDSILKASNVFPQLSDLDYPSGLVKSDFQDYIFTLLSGVSENILSSDLSLEATDQQGITIFNNHYSTAYSFSQAIAKSRRLTEHIYFNPFTNSYFLRYRIDNEDYNDAPFNLYIKLDMHDTKIVKNINSNYIIYKNRAIIGSQLINNIDFNIKDINRVEETKIENDITYSVFKPTDNVKIVAFDKVGGLIKPISLFSFIVSITGLLIFIIALINTKLQVLPEEFDIQFSRSSSLRTRIQLAIIMLIIFSFLVIGILTAFFFKSVLEDYNNNNQKEDITSIRNDIRNSIEGVDNNVMAASTVQAKVAEMSHVHDKNLAFFDEQGKLLTSSFVSPRISQVPFDIVRGFTNPQSVSPNNRILLKDNTYTVEFIPVYYKSQENPYGYLGVTYRPINNSSRSIRDFLSTILNVYVFLFLIAGALAIAIGNSITKPLSILSNKLKEFKLGKTNQMLDWHTKDEIGNLINEYNLLTEKLDESVSILARTERDVAWREMAKQVAHEIKNPLTPMKLSIQYLEKAVKTNPDNAQVMIERVSSTLIEQINNLNQIANEFSNFATMPKASNEKIIINEIVEAIHDLFRKREDMDIQMTEPIDDLFVFADRNHLVRILNNIVKNAIQAIPTDQKGIIKMSLTKKGDKAIVAVKDNGTGIPDDMKEKVFTPNFTTKSSGTGLGLAISANMIESFNGKIYFETELGKGTEFFVEIPLMRLQDNFPENQNRVSLD